MLSVHLAGRLEALCDTDRPVRLRRRLSRLTTAVGSLPNRASVALRLTRVNNGTCVAKIRVHTTQLAAIDSLHALDDKLPGPSIPVAVPTAPSQLAIILSIEVRDMHRAAPVKLHNLVRGAERAPAVDVARPGLLPEGHCVLAHGREPHVVERAGPLALHALGLALADDHVGQRRPVREDEHGRVLARLPARAHARRPLVQLHLPVEGPGHLDCGRLLHGAGRRGEGGRQVWDAAAAATTAATATATTAATTAAASSAVC